MKKSTIELSVGIFLFIGILCIGYLTVKLGKMEWIGDNHYIIKARFRSVTGLRTGAEVLIAGVEVGRVDAIALDAEKMDALVSLKIRKDVLLTEDVIASVKTSGLIGDKYIKLSPGGSDVTLKAGDTILETESPIDLEEMVGKYVFGGV